MKKYILSGKFYPKSARSLSNISKIPKDKPITDIHSNAWKCLAMVFNANSKCCIGF